VNKKESRLLKFQINTSLKADKKTCMTAKGVAIEAHLAYKEL